MLKRSNLNKKSTMIEKLTLSFKSEDQVFLLKGPNPANSGLNIQDLTKF